MNETEQTDQSEHVDQTEPVEPVEVNPEEAVAVSEPREGNRAPKGNVYAVKHGAKSKRDGVVLAKLGYRFSGAAQDVWVLRKALEAELLERGPITLRQKLRVNTALRLELSCRAAEIELRDKSDQKTLTTDELLRIRELIGRWSQARDSIIGALLGDVAEDPTKRFWDDYQAAVDREKLLGRNP